MVFYFSSKKYCIYLYISLMIELEKRKNYEKIKFNFCDIIMFNFPSGMWFHNK